MKKLCKCGCGQETALSYDKKRICDYINGHGSKGSKRSKEVIEKRQISRIYGDLKRSLGIPLDYDYSLCKCGCGEKVKHKNDKYISTHQPSSMIGKKHSKESILKMSTNHRGTGFIGKKHSKESKLKMSSWQINKKLSPEHIRKLKGRIPWNKGKIGVQKSTDKIRLKQSISMIKYIEIHEFDNQTFRTRVGKNEVKIIDMLETAVKENGISNDKNLFLKCGKWPDRFYKKYNLCVDILELHHFKASGELSNYDQNRELIIASRLGCMLYYIPEDNFLKNPDQEIQRFRDFLKLLDISNN